MNIIRAVGATITDRTGIDTFVDESAHRYGVKPIVEVYLADSKTRGTGIGRRGYVKKTGAVPTHFVKRLTETATIQLKAIATANENGSSPQNCVALLEQIRADFLQIVHGNVAVAFIDPDDEQDMQVLRTQIKVDAVRGPQINIEQEPMTHEATLMLSVPYRVRVETPVTRIVEHVDIIHEVANGS